MFRTLTSSPDKLNKEAEQKFRPGTSPVIQWLRLCASTTGAAGSVPGCGRKVPRAAWCGQTVAKIIFKNKSTQKMRWNRGLWLCLYCTAWMLVSSSASAMSSQIRSLQTLGVLHTCLQCRTWEMMVRSRWPWRGAAGMLWTVLRQRLPHLETGRQVGAAVWTEQQSGLLALAGL